MKLMNFQLNAIKELHESVESGFKNIVLKSPTGSGKTIILTHFMDEYLKGHPKKIFVWLTPGKGSLEEQSKAKMDKYIHNSQTKLLLDVMTNGFAENDCCFINWEKLTKKGNNALKDSERTNFLEHIEKAFDNDLEFKIIIDESHQNFTEKSDAIVQLFHTSNIIRCSATPIVNKQDKLIEIKEEDVIAEGLIKKLVAINENFPQVISTNNQTQYLLEHALNKQRELKQLYLSIGVDINPLIIVQMPNNSDLLLETIEDFFEKQNINYENTLALWLSGRHENLDRIEENNAPQIAVIIKQAVATGWDCPRAHILVKLRENMDETFEIQTIGRIRRMPEAKHYENDALDTCYLYTFDSKFTEGVKNSLGKGALDVKTIFLKNEHKQISLVKEQRTMITDFRNPRKALSSINQYLKNEYNLTGNKTENKTRLQTAGYIFSQDIIKHSVSGNIATLDKFSEKDNFNDIQLTEAINTHYHGRDFHNRVGRIGLEIGLEYSYMNTIISKLFGEKFEYREKLLNLTTRELYAFVINNFDKLRNDIKNAMAVVMSQLGMDLKNISLKEFKIPQSMMFTYDSQNKIQTESESNVYQGYLMSAEPRSSSEKKFEKFCENCKVVDWFYKNGDKGEEFMSIVYLDNADGQKLFYPDYIISVNGQTWIVETKGGFTRTGESEDIDKFSPKKFEILQSYLKKHNLQGGFVRYDKQSEELCICMDNYSDDIHSEHWKILSDVIK